MVLFSHARVGGVKFQAVDVHEIAPKLYEELPESPATQFLLFDARMSRPKSNLTTNGMWL
jgi:hypothetical protein